MAKQSQQPALETSRPDEHQRRLRFPWLGLQDKLLIAMTLLVAVTLLASGAAFIWFSSQQVRQLKRHEGGHVAVAAAVAAAPFMAGRDIESLSDLARELLRAPDVMSIAFYDRHGVPVVAWQRLEGELTAFTPPSLPPQAVAMSETRGDQAGHLDVLLPVIVDVSDGEHLQPAGFVGVRITHASAVAYVQRTARQITGGGLLVLAIVLPLVFLLVHRAFRPIRRLALAARHVAEGRFETVDIVRQDALGTLADAFNFMVRRLAEQKERADQAQARLLEANLSLERKVAERTAGIEMASSRLASEIAEKEDFLRAVSHDLNAPLRNIDGMATMLLRKHGNELPVEVVRRLDRIKKNVQHETELINDLLELSRIKTRRTDPEPVNLEEMMWDLRGLFENDLRERSIDLIIESRLPTLHAEKGRVRQVFQNLIDNAIKYMGEGPVREIRVGARVGRSETEFWVRDTGLGIAAEDLDKVFYVFRRGRNQQNVTGKGVGLASVKSIIENYLGSIWVESEPGRGSTFRFTINARFVRADGTLFSTRAQTTTQPSPQPRDEAA